MISVPTPTERSPRLDGPATAALRADLPARPEDVPRRDLAHAATNATNRPEELAVTSPTPSEAPVLDLQSVWVKYSGKPAVQDVTLPIPANAITALIGPSGCGKSTLLRSLNRMNDFVDGATVEGRILLRGKDLYARGIDPVEVRREVGMVFQKPNPFPKTIFWNVAWGPKINGWTGDLAELVEGSLKAAALWDEVKDRLNESALALSGGQQQRLCIARALSMQPKVILLDEPCSALDPLSTARIEELLIELKRTYTIVIVTHNMQQAGRVSDLTAFMYQGALIEHGATKTIFTNPQNQRTHDYITGRFG
jgi:phosphate transport system ATP-binding protein